MPIGEVEWQKNGGSVNGTTYMTIRELAVVRIELPMSSQPLSFDPDIRARDRPVLEERLSGHLEEEGIKGNLGYGFSQITNEGDTKTYHIMLYELLDPISRQ